MCVFGKIVPTIFSVIPKIYGLKMGGHVTGIVITGNLFGGILV